MCSENEPSIALMRRLGFHIEPNLHPRRPRPSQASALPGVIGTLCNPARLLMLRDDLLDIPVCALPDGYGLRWYEPGDERHWLDLQTPFYEPGRITAELFDRQYGRDRAPLRERMCFVSDAAGQPVATATAWHHDGFRDPAYGRIHWVAVAAALQGRGLGKALLTATLSRLVELGHARAYLTTSWARPAAVRLYRSFGFRPARDDA